MTKKIQAIFCFLAVYSQLTAFPFVGLAELPGAPDEIVSFATDRLSSGEVFSAAYQIESIPDKDFIDYHLRLGTIPAGISENEFLSNNHKTATQSIVWGVSAYDLISFEKVNGIATKRQQLFSDGLLVDYFPERPSAYIRAPNHPADYLTLYDLLNQVPAERSALSDPLRANGWKSILEIIPQSLDSHVVKETDESYTLTFFREFSGYTTQGLPQSVISKMWRYTRDPETNEYRQYLVREIKCSIQSIGFADSGYDFSLDLDVGTFVTDEMTGSQYRVGNPLNALMRKLQNNALLDRQSICVLCSLRYDAVRDSQLRRFL